MGKLYDKESFNCDYDVNHRVHNLTIVIMTIMMVSSDNYWPVQSWSWEEERQASCTLGRLHRHGWTSPASLDLPGFWKGLWLFSQNDDWRPPPNRVFVAFHWKQFRPVWSAPVYDGALLQNKSFVIVLWSESSPADISLWSKRDAARGIFFPALAASPSGKKTNWSSSPEILSQDGF